MSHRRIETIAHDRYTEFDRKRKHQEALEADAEDLKALEVMERQMGEESGE